MINQFIVEIQEQPAVLKNILQYCQSDEVKRTLEQIRNLWSSGKYDKIIFTGMGSSYFVSLSVAAMLSSKAVPAFAINAGELLHLQYPLLDKHTLLVCISQSGESYEIVELLHLLAQKMVVVAISNEENSTLAKKATYKLMCKAGKEEMTSTKTFISTYLLTYLFSKNLLNAQVDYGSLNMLATEVERLLNTRNLYLSNALAILKDTQFVQVIGRGTDYASVAQSALMIMEVTKTPASAILGGEFRHGPLEMVEKDFVGILFANYQSGTYDQTMTLALDILKFGGKIIFISDCISEIKHPNFMEIEVHCKDSDLLAIPAIIPIQLIVNAWAENKGITPGNFTHGAKVTSIE